ncbi:MAG: PASTA domain-containing protein [Acidimicrobiaceae bacterium]|nr:PASTA domain-containing protein [Acidimicrobiaceae bacterium]
MISSQEAKRAFGGRYRLLDFVGEGSNGRVYVAGDLTLRRRVALKILRADTAERPGFPERFADEMRATSALSHPRVLPVYDWGLEPQPYVVTEYLAGGSLAAVLHAGYRLTPSQALMVGLEAARALVNIHKGARAHLGLTPSSILFDSSARPYISDLGLAAALGATAEQPAGTDESDPTSTADPAPGSTAAAAAAADPALGSTAAAAAAADPALGSTAAAAADPDGAPVTYSRIEQAQDVHDLALVLCEAVTGNRDLTVDVGGEEPVPITALGPLQAVLERAIAADPIGRLTANELASELLRVASLLPRPDPLPLAISKAPPGDAAATPASSPEAFEQIGPTVSERSAIPHDDVPRRRWPGLALAVVLVLGGAAGGVWAWLSSGSDATVPELQGRTRAEAASAAADSGWEVNEILVRAPYTERGEIVSTEPAAGAPLSEGATLDVFVSLGEPLILVSALNSLYGMTVGDATGELEAAGLVVAGETLAFDEVVPAGNVIGLEVGEGVYELEAGTEVDLLVSDGPADRTVPAVPESGEPGLAVDMINALQLAPRLVMEFSPDVPEGTVIGFRPVSGSTVPVDGTVHVRVSRGPEPPPPEDPPVVGFGDRLDGADADQGSESEGDSSEG